MFDSHIHSLRNYGSQFRNSELVEDCIQEIFLDLLCNRVEFRKIKHMRAYLCRCLKNRVTKSQKGSAVEIAASRLGDNEIGTSYPDDRSSRLPAEGYSEEMYRTLEQVFQSLSAKERRAIELRFIKGQGFHEMARSLTTTRYYAITLVQRTLAKMRTKLMQLLQKTH